jgi:hypothetical protein
VDDGLAVPTGVQPVQAREIGGRDFELTQWPTVRQLPVNAEQHGLLHSIVARDDFGDPRVEIAEPSFDMPTLGAAPVNDPSPSDSVGLGRLRQ